MRNKEEKFSLQMNSSSQVSRDELTDCIISRRPGSENLQNAVVMFLSLHFFTCYETTINWK